MVGNLQPGCAGELIGLSLYEGRESQSRIEARLLAPTDRRSRQRSARCHRCRGEPFAGLGEGERQAQRSAHGDRRELFDPAREPFLDPLQHETIGSNQAQAFPGQFKAKRANPGVELLFGELPLEGLEATLPEGGRRHDRWVAKRKKTAGATRSPSSSNSNSLAVGYPQHPSANLP